jgi:phenylpropionate dioxygenase-like ring-hydroxylating dioxygenase large terminal subunit
MRNNDPGLRCWWHPVAQESDVPIDRPIGVRVLGEPWAIVRLGNEIVAMQDRCPHRLVPLSAGTVVGSELQCAYHGYRFDRTGKVTAIPAVPDLPIPVRACVTTAPAMVRFGMVWICPSGNPLDDLLDDAGFLDPLNDIFVAGPFTTRVSAGTLADNFLDAAHFPFLHAGTFGAEDDGIPNLQVERSGWRIRQTDQQMVDGAHLAAAEPSTATYTIGAPFAVELRLDRVGGTDYIWSFACPVDASTSRWWMVHAYPLAGDQVAIQAACDLQTQVGVEDLWILEQMDDPVVPLDIRAEMHTRADLGSIEYRRMLSEIAALGKTSPTAT